ncbi:hypothetical protein [uncultured Prevotella sp.]|uniref:hypothetical protein n=1 Tax=uncultured Prevotella sp. TaxID=159272 RepID=UPI0025E6347A|nr:hypothetical protein [uncultured Prevotella sp.]
MTLEYLEIMEEMKKQEKEVQGASSPRRKLQKSFKSNTRIYDDGSIEVDPQAQGEPSQKDVKKVGKSKRYITSGKNPLTCVELKCPEEVPDKAAYFRKELDKLTKDIQIEKPELPDGEFLVNKECLKVCLVKGEHPQLMAWLTFEVEGLLDVRKQLYQLTSEIDKCFVINEASVCQQR